MPLSPVTGDYNTRPFTEPNPKTGHQFSVRVHVGSFRSDTKTAKALTTAPTNGSWDWINSGIASPEIGFRIVKKN